MFINQYKNKYLKYKLKYKNLKGGETPTMAKINEYLGALKFDYLFMNKKWYDILYKYRNIIEIIELEEQVKKIKEQFQLDNQLDNQLIKELELSEINRLLTSFKLSINNIDNYVKSENDDNLYYWNDDNIINEKIQDCFHIKSRELINEDSESMSYTHIKNLFVNKNIQDESLAKIYESLAIIYNNLYTKIYNLNMMGSRQYHKKYKKSHAVIKLFISEDEYKKYENELEKFDKIIKDNINTQIQKYLVKLDNTLITTNFIVPDIINKKYKYMCALNTPLGEIIKTKNDIKDLNNLRVDQYEIIPNDLRESYHQCITGTWTMGNCLSLHSKLKFW